MSKTTRLFNSVPVEQQKASSFDMSFYSCGTGMTGTLTPVFKQEIIPGDLISLGIMSQIDLPPMATSPMGRIDMRYEAFFVPNRITWGKEDGSSEKVRHGKVASDSYLASED